MTTECSRYELVARADGRRRAGALLRVTFADGVRGYADVHPWPELGDPPLDRQLAALAQGRPEPLAARSLALARSDGEARAAGRSLFEGLTVPPSHLSLPFGFRVGSLARAVAQGYERIKLKGWNFAAEDRAAFRASGLRFRLDFNAGLPHEAVERLLDGWGDLDWIDWIEDPCPYDPVVWASLRARVRLAMDFERGERAFDVRIVKPARDARPAPGLQPPTSLAFTSYLDHPLGQLGAAWAAARAVGEGLPVVPGGLVTHEVYRPNAFSARLGVEKAHLVPPGGPGLGFARELDALEWRRLEA